MARAIEIQDERLSVIEKIKHFNWGLIALLFMLAAVGTAALYSAAGGNMQPWAAQQLTRFFAGLFGMFVIALIDMRWWMRLAYPIYVVGLVMLIIVEVMGVIGMGAQRWINLGFIQLQPSELMKIAVILALARYFHAATLDDVRRIVFLIPPTVMILVPVGLVMTQPDLGTAMLILMAGGAFYFIVGVPKWMFAAVLTLGLSIMPVAWHLLHDYQKKRVFTFLDPESDPLGAGYHIMQSKIALGSGGIDGKGFLKGTQSHLDYLPEKQTDFIFTLWSEEMGLFGGLLLLLLFGLIFMYGIWISLRCRHAFGKLVAAGITINFSLHIFVNIAMVMGLLPVVGVPLPMMSYGGTAMLSALAGFGLIMSCYVHRDSKLPRM